MGDTNRTVTVFEAADALADAAARYVAERSSAATGERGRFAVALAGGSTPRLLHERLVGPSWIDKIDWRAWHVFVGDERLVPPSDKNSNFKMIRETLLAHVPIPADQIHPVPVEAGAPDVVASAYAADIRRTFGIGNGEWPRFDLILLGLGSDGHTASLFPGKPSLDERSRLLVASPPGILPPPVDRVTLTLPVLNAARAVAFMATGADKAAAVQAAVEDKPLGEVSRVPASLVRPDRGEIRWFLDAAAASRLARRS